MENFSDFIFNKNLENLAERCVKQQIPIVEFVNWYKEEGQYLDEAIVEGVLDSTLAGAGMGAGVGSYFGSPLAGAGIGAGAGALYGLGKKAYDYFTAPGKNYNATKKQALDSLIQLAKMSPRHGQVLGNIVRYINNKIQPNPGPTSASRTVTPTAPAGATVPNAVPHMSLDDLFKNGLATREDLKRIAAMPQAERDAEIVRLLRLQKSREGI